MRYHVKGGIWKNTEDETLKAAVMKYGLNQWSRISSLLVRKSSKQCKERWYEWLDPSIKKIEWSKDEEEKLLNLAKMFPCQWRTIAPMVGRTAYQCMEHYERLLDRAQGRETDENDPRKLRPGEIDPNPETKPARPDPIDMDEDQKEMLNEARARLANTKGKKAKRKAREKQLEEARRLAGLQKKRELKSAGIDVVLRLPRKKKKEMNYNMDVPFLRKIPEGNWAIPPEETPAPNKFKGAISLQFLENKNRDEEEEKFRKIDQKRMKNLKKKNLPDAIEMINKINDPTTIFQRNKLVLPEPQVTDRDLEGISKLTSAGMAIQDSAIQETNPTKVLMGEYSQREMTPLAMLRTPKVEDNIMREAKLAISLRETSTPLIGGENSASDLQNFLEYKKTEMRKDEFKAPFPKTPNILTNTIISNERSFSTKHSDQRNKQASQQNSFAKTPLRDEMKINLENDVNSWDNSSVNNKDNFSVNSNFTKLPNINQLLSRLPKPQNKYEIDIIDDETLNIMKKEEESTDVPMEIEDEEDKKKRIQQEIEQEEKLKFVNETQVIQRALLRPLELNKTYQSYLENKLLSIYDEEEIEDLEYRKEAEELLMAEMNKLIEYDAINHPQKGLKMKAIEEEAMNLDEVTLEDKTLAAEYLNMEIEEMKSYHNFDSESVNNIKNEVLSNIYYIPDVQRYCHIDDMEPQQKFDSYSEIYEIRKNMILKEEAIAKKLEEKSNILMGGYFKKIEVLNKKYSDIANDINEYRKKHKTYQELKNQEELSLLKRQRDLEDKIEILKEKERHLQKDYRNLNEYLSELEKV